MVHTDKASFQTVLFISILSISVVAGAKFVNIAAAESTYSLPLFSMLNEYIDYTIFTVNGTPWARIDGTYPIRCIDGSEAGNVLMVYPTPPGTTNISVKFNETTLVCSSYTETYPDALHHTAIGDWSMIQCIINPSDYFVLQIHYEHPIMLVNGSYTFLYDLNISPYLSPSYPNSTAYFSIRTETNCSDLKVFAVPSDNVRNPVDYMVQNEGNAERITFNVTSEYSKALPGDIIVAFAEYESQVPEPFPTTLFATASAASVAIVAAGLLVYFKKRKSS